jgi:hypothetical protein
MTYPFHETSPVVDPGTLRDDQSKIQEVILMQQRGLLTTMTVTTTHCLIEQAHDHTPGRGG